MSSKGGSKKGYTGSGSDLEIEVETDDIDQRQDHILEIFDAWTESEFRNTLRAEPLISRLYRRLSVWAGLLQPLNENDYRKGLHQEYKGNEDDFHTYYLLDKCRKANSGYQLHSTTLPFDARQLFQEASLSFLLCAALLYLVGLSLLFCLWGWAMDCFRQDTTIGNAIPQGFLLLSGKPGEVLKSNDDIDNNVACMWMNSVAILIGTYVSLPVFAAAVLVGLLDNPADLIQTSNVMLLTKRGGQPVIMMRCCSGNGRALGNFNAKLHALMIVQDSEINETFVEGVKLNIIFHSMLCFFPTIIKHVCDEQSPLIQKGVVVVDEYGVPSWDRTKFMGFFLSCQADNSKHHEKNLTQDPRLFIEPDSKGRLPFFENSTPSTLLHWKKYRGKVSMVNDLSKLSSWKYNSVELRTDSVKEE